MTASTLRTAFLALLLVLPATAVAATRPAEPQLTADPTAVQAGTTLTLTGTGFPRNVHVTLLAGPPRADATRIGGATTGRRGRFTATIRIRPHSSAGTFVASACYDACDVKATTHFRIVGP